MAWRCVLLTLVAGLRELQPLPRLALLPGEMFKLPLDHYFAGNSLSYSISQSNQGQISVKHNKELDFNTTLELDGCQPLGIPVVYVENEAFVFYLTACGVSQLKLTTETLELMWTLQLVGINTWGIGNNSLSLLVNQTELYIIEGGKEAQTAVLSFEDPPDKVIPVNDLLVVLYNSELVLYRTTDMQICGNLTSFQGNSLLLVDLTYTDRLYALDQVWGLLLILINTNCQAEPISYGNITSGTSPKFGLGNSDFLPIETSIGAYLLSTPSLALLNFQPLASPNIQASVTNDYLLVAGWKSTGEAEILIKGIDAEYVDLYREVAGSVAVAVDNFVLIGDKEGLAVYVMRLEDCYLEGQGSGNITLKLQIHSDFPSEETKSYKFRVDILPFHSTTILHGTGLQASIKDQSFPSLPVYLNQSKFEAKLPLNSLFSGANLRSFSANATLTPGLIFDSAALESPYVQEMKTGEWVEGWELGCSAGFYELIAYQQGFIALFDLSQSVISIQAKEPYEGTFQACAQTPSGFILLSAANNLQSLLTLFSPSLQSGASLYLPDQCSRLKVGVKYLLCIGTTLLHVCTLDLASCVRVSALEVANAVPFSLYDADFIVDTTLILADKSNGIRTLDVYGLITGQETVPFIANLGPLFSPIQIVSDINAIYLLSANYTELDITTYPNLRVKRLFPLSKSGVIEAFRTEKYIYVREELGWEVIYYGAETALQAQQAFISVENGTFLVLSTPNFDLFLNLFPNLSTFSLFQVSPPATPLQISLFGTVTDSAQLPSVSSLLVPVLILAESENSSANTTLIVEIRLQGYYLWVSADTVSLNIDVNETYWVDLRTVFYGKEMEYSGKGDEGIGAALLTGVTHREIEGCAGGLLWAAVGLNKIAFLTGNIVEVCELEGNSLISLFKYSFSTSFSANFTAISAVSNPFSIYISTYCESISPLASYLIQLQYGLLNGLIVTEITPAPAPFQRSLSFVSNTTLFTVGFSPISGLFHLSQASLDLKQQTSKAVSKANLGLDEFVLVDIDGFLSDLQVLSLYITTESGHFLQVNIGDFGLKLAKNREIKGTNVVACGNTLLVQGDQAILVIDSEGHVEKEIYIYEEGWNGIEMSCFNGKYEEFAAIWMEIEGNFVIGILGFRSEPANSLLAVFPASNSPIFLSSTSLIYENSTFLCLSTLQSPLLQLSPVSASISGVYSVTAWNKHTGPVTVDFGVNRTEERVQREDLGRVSGAGWWVWAIIGAAGVGAAVTTMVVFIRKRKRPAPHRRSINISLNPIPPSSP